MREFKTWRDPYDVGFSTCRPTKIQIESGLTVLVGCNGAGKSTLLFNIKDELEKESTPYLYFDNKKDGGSNSLESLMYHGDMTGFANLWTSSEGEQIRYNIGRISSTLKEFLETGETEKTRNHKKWACLFGKEIEEKDPGKERWILLDAVDSGYSIDNVVELKELFKIIFEDARNLDIELYIVISANEYELANGENCFDVNRGKYIKFRNYNNYRKFILKSRKLKEDRLERAAEKRKSASWRRNHGEN